LRLILDSVAFAANNEITFASDEFSVRLGAIGAYLQATLGVRLSRPVEDQATGNWWFRLCETGASLSLGTSYELVVESGHDEDELFELLDRMEIPGVRERANGRPILLTTEGPRFA
jgi:hypothetical protein